jgi:hypothetical protein
MMDGVGISREILLKRAAAAVGAVYTAPILTSSARAAAKACSGQPCTPGKKGNRKCKRLGGKTCKCNGGRCERAATCGQDDRCGPQPPCDEGHPCDQDLGCFCLVLANSGGKTECVAFRSGGCGSQVRCNKETGLGCPPGDCCLDTCCPEGICLSPCHALARPTRDHTSTSGSEPTL